MKGPYESTKSITKHTNTTTTGNTQTCTHQETRALTQPQTKVMNAHAQATDVRYKCKQAWTWAPALPCPAGEVSTAAGGRNGGRPRLPGVGFVELPGMP